MRNVGKILNEANIDQLAQKATEIIIQVGQETIARLTLNQGYVVVFLPEGCTPAYDRHSGT